MEESLKTQVFIQFLPTNTELIDSEIGSLFRGGKFQTLIICKFFTCFFTVGSMYPYSRIG